MDNIGQWIRPLIGIAICSLSALFFCIQNVLVKHLSHVDPFTISCLRFLIIGLLSTPVTMSRVEKESPFPRGKRVLLVLRCVLGATNLMVHYYSLQRLPLADTMMISATSPMFTVFYARYFIKESIVVADIANVLLVFAGIVLIVKPPFIFGTSEMYSAHPEAIYAVIAMILGSVFLQATVYVTLRLLKDVHWSVTCSAFGVFGFIEALTVTLIWGQTCLPESGLERFYIILVGVTSYFGQITLVVSAQFESAANVALLRKAFDVVFAFIFQILFFHQIPGAYSVMGALLITLAVISSGAKKMYADLPTDHSFRAHRFWQWLYASKTSISS